MNVRKLNRNKRCFNISTVEDVTKTRFFVYQEEIQHRTLHESWKVTLISVYSIPSEYERAELIESLALFLFKKFLN